MWPIMLAVMQWFAMGIKVFESVFKIIVHGLFVTIGLLVSNSRSLIKLIFFYLLFFSPCVLTKTTMVPHFAQFKVVTSNWVPLCALGHPWICENGVAPDRALDPAVLSRLKQFSVMNKLKKMALRVSM